MLNRLFALSVVFLLHFSLHAQLIRGTEAQQYIKGAEMLRFADENPFPQYIRLKSGEEVSFNESALWLSKHLKLPQGTSFEVLADDIDRRGNRHLRLQQYFDGYLVKAGQIILHGNSDNWDHATGELFSPSYNGTQILLSREQAIGIALDELPASKYGWEVSPALSTYPKAQLVWVPSAFKFNKNSFQLAYAVKVYAAKPLAHKTLFLDVATGDVIATEEHIQTHDDCQHNQPSQSASNATSLVPGTAVTAYSGTRSIETTEEADKFILHDQTRGQGIITYDCQTQIGYPMLDFIDNDNFWDNVNPAMDEVATDAHWGTEAYYDYLLSLGRNSIDNNGELLQSHIHYATNFGNAFWDGTRMTYGDGDPNGNLPVPLTSLDVVAHELTHGLTERTSNLIYADESGALNESFSDIFGATLNWHENPNQATWTIGADITLDGNGIRNMEDPNIHQNPDTYDGDFWVDGAGVHTNSGVQNHWFQLLVDGEVGTNELGFSYNLEGMALDTAAEIAYQNNAFYLTPSSNYQDAGFNAVLAAGNLYGTCSEYTTKVYDAWQAVNVIFSYPGIISANFTLERNIFCDANAPINFINTSFAESFIWDFGDGNTSTEQSPSHVYGEVGSYTVTLTAFGGECNSDTVTNIVENAVIIDPESIYCTSYFLDANQEVSECSGVLFDSGGPEDTYSNNENFTFTINNPAGGAIELELVFFNTESDYDFLTIYDGPDQNSPIIANLDGIHTGETYTSSGSSVTLRFDSDGSVINPGFEIVWGNGQGSGPADASFTSSTTTPYISQAVTFTPVAPSSQSLIYDFGDGSPLVNGVGATSHAYQAAGTYQVTAIDNNCLEQDTFSLTIEVAIGTDFSITPADICDTLVTNQIADHVVTITNTGTNTGYVGFEAPALFSFYTASGIPADGLVLESGESVDLTVTLDATGLLPDTYLGLIFINTSDSSQASTTIPIKLRVIGTVAAGYSTFFLNLGTVLTNETTSGSFVISSIGTDTLVIDSITSTNPLFSTSPATPFSLAPQESRLAQIDFMGSPTAEFIAGQILISTNAGTGVVNYIIEIVDGPVANLSPDSLCITLDAGTSLDTSLFLDNTGLATLEYQFSTSYADSSLQVFEGDGAFTTHAFTDVPAITGLELEIVIQGDFDLDGEFVSININGTDYGQLPDNGLDNEEDTIYFPLPTELIGETDLEITLQNSNQVDDLTGYANRHEIYIRSQNLDWMIFNSDSSALPAETSIEFPITFDATNLNAGVYEASIFFESNDPLIANKEIPVKLIVIGSPEIMVAPDTLNFGGVQLTTSEILPLRVFNTGTDVLVIESVTIGSGQYAADQFDFTIQPDEFQDINVIFAPSMLGELNTSMTISGPTNNIVVPILGTGLSIPEGVLSRDTICVTLLEGQTSVEAMTLSNLGQSDLIYDTGLGGLGNRTLVWTYQVDQSSLNNMMTVLTDPNMLLDVTLSSSIDPSELATSLANTDLLVIPDLEIVENDVISVVGPVFADWMDNGGQIIAVGNDASNISGEMELHDGIFHNQVVENNAIVVEEEDHPLLADVQLPLTIQGGMSFVVPVSANNPDVNIIVSRMGLENQGIIFTQQKNLGQIIYLGFKYEALTQNNEQILRNAIELTRTEIPFPDWLTVDNTNGTLAAENSTDINITFNANDLSGGTYTFPLTYQFNQPTNNLGLTFLKLIVAASPNVAFSSSNEAICDGIISFIDESLQNPTSWQWDFGDGNTSTQQNPTHIYTNSGTYTVRLIGCNDIGCDTLSLTDFVTIDLEDPFCQTTTFENGADLQISGCSGTIHSTNFPEEYPNNVNSSIQITSDDGFPIRLTVNSFIMETCCDWLRVYDGPDANAPLIGEWNGIDLAAGDNFESTGGVIYLRFTTDVSVVRAGFELLWQCITPMVPVAEFSSPDILSCDGMVDFNDESVFTPTSWSWDFGDGNTSDEQNPTHTYSQNGSYTVSLTACNDLGCNTIVKNSYVVVNSESPLCDQVSFEDNASIQLDGCEGVIVSTNFPDSYPGGVNSNIQITADAGTVSITVNSFELENCCDFLTAYDGPDASANLIGQWNGNELVPGDLIESTGSQIYLTFTTNGSGEHPGFELTWTCVSGIENVAISATSEDDCPSTFLFEAINGLPSYTYDWDFGDGTTENGPGVHAHTYAATGSYMATLTVSDGTNAVTSQTEIEVSALNIPLSISGPDTVEVNQIATFSENNNDQLNIFTWSEANGNTGTGTDYTTSWNAVGTYEIRLDAGSDATCSAAAVKTVVVVLGSNVNDADTVHSLAVYPNPAGNTLYFELSATGLTALNYSILDAMGRRVLDAQLDQLPSNSPVSIDLSQLPKASYLIILSDSKGNRLATRRFVKR